MFNKVDLNTINAPMSNLYEQNSSIYPLVDNMSSSNQFYNDLNDESSNFKIQQLIAKRRSITSSPIRKTTNIKASHQTQPFEINSNENEFNKANLYEGFNSSQIVKSSSNKAKR